MNDDSPTFATFNPTHDERVTLIKEKTDELIALVREHANDTAEGERRAELATDAYELAAMWAVKACFS